LDRPFALFAAQGAFLMSAICPECDSPIDVDEYDVDIGDELTCSECGSLLRVSSDAPLEFELADEDDDLDEEEEDDAEEEEEEDAELDEDTDEEDDDRIDDDE
jgi:alpha-aminoadipate/glutamate carrier protein LysW